MITHDTWLGPNTMTMIGTSAMRGTAFMPITNGRITSLRNLKLLITRPKAAPATMPMTVPSSDAYTVDQI